MINKAMFYDKNKLNGFTYFIKLNTEVLNKPTIVKSRGGEIFEVVYQEESEKNGCHELLRTKNWSHIWNLDGSSITNSYLDICYLLKN